MKNVSHIRNGKRTYGIETNLMVVTVTCVHKFVRMFYALKNFANFINCHLLELYHIIYGRSYR